MKILLGFEAQGKEVVVLAGTPIDAEAFKKRIRSIYR